MSNNMSSCTRHTSLMDKHPWDFYFRTLFWLKGWYLVFVAAAVVIVSDGSVVVALVEVVVVMVMVFPGIITFRCPCLRPD